MKERRKRELVPVLDLLADLEEVQIENDALRTF